MEDNSNFKDLNPPPQNDDIVVENISSLTHLLQISARAILFSLPILIPMYILNLLNAGFVAFKTRMSIDMEQFIVAYADQDQAYMNEIANSASDIFAYFVFSNFVIIFLYTLIYSSIANSRYENISAKIVVFFNMILSRGIALFITLLIKNLLILIGLMLFIIPGVMIWLSLMFVEYVVIFERKSFIEACLKSHEMMKGVKSNFLTFISILSFAIIPVFLLKTFFNFEIESSSIIMGNDLNISFLAATLIETVKYTCYGTYFVMTCLLYFKRKSI